MTTPLVKPGDVLAGKYRVERILGQGTMGMVVRAVDVERDERFALKLMRPTALDAAEAVERFLREARASSRLTGEHVARVREVGTLESGAPFMAMEYLEGRDLRAVLDKRGRLPMDEVVSIALQACEALAEAHAAGIVHRDLKPANLFLARKYKGGPHVIKVVDFGVSKILGESGNGGDVTKSYVMLGSPHYMSPEQMRSSRDVDARTDVWSLGVIMYELLTGRVPFEGKGITQIISSVLAGAPAPPSSVVPGLPPALDAVVMRCLENDVDQRWPSVAALAAALAPFAPPLTGAEPRPRAGKLALALTVLLAFVAGGGLAWLLFGRR